MPARGRAQIHGRLPQVGVQLPQLRQHRQNHIRNIKGDVGHQQRTKAQGEAQHIPREYEQQHQAHAGDDVGIGHGDVVDGHKQVPGPPLHGVEADSRRRAQDRGNQRRQHRHREGGAESAEDLLVLEQLLIPMQGEAGPDRAALGVVEGEDDQHGNGQVQKQEHQYIEYLGDNRIPILHHIITAPSSPSPKRFIMSMAIITSSSIIREMALP